MPRYADVALPVAVDTTFTYLIPPELEESATVGVRVIVPFGRKYATGLIVDHPSSSDILSLKPIHDVVDATQVVSGDLLRLCRWAADYYFAPLGEVFKAAIPHGFSSSGKRMVFPLEEFSLSGVPSTRNAPGRDKLLALLASHGPMSSFDLKKKTGLKSINHVLNQLERAGRIRTEEILPKPKAKAKLKPFLLMGSLNRAHIESVLASLPPRKRNARKLMTTLLTLHPNEDMPVQDVMKKARVTSTTIKEFVETGVLRTEMREVSRQQEYGTEEATRNIILNPTQSGVLSRINAAVDGGKHRTLLLHGVTGSGKTQVYIEAIRHCLDRGKTALVMVPEISLTPQIVRRFRTHFGDRVAVVHSRMSPGERHDVWRLALRGDYTVVIGPRSAVFAPLQNLGLLVVDEEHEASYKQFDALPRYNARDAAIVRASYLGATVVLGSATPSTESYHNATQGKYDLLEMPDRIDEVRMPDITIVDMTAERKREYATLKESLPDEKRKQLREFQQSSFSSLLKEKILDRLSRKEGIILLQNRRGFAPFVECVDCGYSESCDNCNVTLTYHLTKKHLRCHYCGLVRTPHSICPQCKGVNIQLRGIGTQKVEQELAALFPDARVLRMDLDTTSRKGAHDRILRKFGDGEADMLLGTQMVAKGLDFARVTLVGVISADTQMLLPDFRASERTFQLLTQVAGRAGRSTLHGEVIIQTHQPKHYTLQHVIDHDFKAFFDQEMEARRELSYPPFSRLALVEMKGKNEPYVRQESERFFGLMGMPPEGMSLLGPSPAVIGKINNYYRWHIIIKSDRGADPSGARVRSLLRRTIKASGEKRRSSVRLIVDVDPVGLL